MNLFREDSSQCRICARKEKLRNPAIKLANGIVAQPREAWSRDILRRIGAL